MLHLIDDDDDDDDDNSGHQHQWEMLKHVRSITKAHLNISKRWDEVEVDVVREVKLGATTAGADGNDEFFALRNNN